MKASSCNIGLLENRLQINDMQNESDKGCEWDDDAWSYFALC